MRNQHIGEQELETPAGVAPVDKNPATALGSDLAGFEGAVTTNGALFRERPVQTNALRACQCPEPHGHRGERAPITSKASLPMSEFV